MFSFLPTNIIQQATILNNIKHFYNDKPFQEENVELNLDIKQIMHIYKITL